MAGIWQLHEAKNKLSKVVDEAIADGPQVITRHGEEVVVVLAASEFRRLVASQKKLSEFFRESPLAEANIDLSRDKSPIRSRVQL